ncbi:MAG: hypothetical protein JWQ09_1511 [Segetibacter sp.]|nr:hypothetical protein [Segetibacter sp.]
MEATLKHKVSEIFSRYNFSKEDATFISEVLSEIDDRQNQKFEISKELFLTQKDKVDLIDRIQSVEKSINKTVYIVGLVQFIAIVASVLAIINFIVK